jgi:hypothetical protein
MTGIPSANYRLYSRPRLRKGSFHLRALVMIFLYLATATHEDVVMTEWKC